MNPPVSSRNAYIAKIFFNHLDKKVARPSLKAFLFAYLYVTLPKVLNYLIVAIRNGKLDDFVSKLLKVLTNALNPLKFPMFAAKLVAGINLLEPVIYSILRDTNSSPKTAKSKAINLFLSTLISSFISSCASFPDFQNHILGYGRYYLLDLTLLVVTRAVDTALSSTLAKHLGSSSYVDGNAVLFIVSCSFIMYAWFYHPETLPPLYKKWITSAANMDQEIIDALKYLKDGTLVYGEHGEHDELLTPYCERYGVDPKHGSLITNQPLLCDTVHAYQTSNCELHALWRFARGFLFAIKIYGPINIIMVLFSISRLKPRLISRKMAKIIINAVKSSVRSSCFLGGFIGLYWYAVCLTRRKLVPKLFPQYPLTKWDAWWAPTAGAIACGFSLFIERASRRKELALFVAPRALGTIISPEPTLTNLRIEAVAFSISMAVLIAYSKSSPNSVRGIFGKGLKQVFSISHGQGI